MMPLSAASPPGAAADTGTWLLTLSRSDPGRITVRGGISAESGGVFVSFDGFLVDRGALAAALDLPSVPSSDAALVLAAYGQFGSRFLDHLRGAFGVAVIDQPRRTWVVARDAIGLHPVFFAERGSDFLFSTRQQTLIAQPGISKDLNRVALADHLCWRLPDPGETLFASVRRVLPGSSVTLTSGQISIRRYWDPVPDPGFVNWLTTPEAIAFDTRFDRAVSRAIEGGPVGVFLSGGLDSISVAAVAADRLRLAGAPVPRGLSLVYPDPLCDERSVQSGVADQLRLPLDLLNFDDAVGPRGLLLQSMELNRSLGSPLLNTWGPAYLELARRGHRNGVRTILTGTGGDEWMTLSPFLVADLMRQGDVRGMAQHIRVWQRSNQLPLLTYTASLLWRFGMRPVAGQIFHRTAPGLWNTIRNRRAVREDPRWLSPDPALRRTQFERAGRRMVDPDPAAGFYLREVSQALHSGVVSWELEEQYEFGQHTGVRFMHPYWDADLVDALYRSTPALLNAGGFSKGLVRHTLATRFPELGFARQRKVSATTFLQSTFGRELPGAFASLGSDASTLAALGVVDRKAANRVVERSMRGNLRQRQIAWMLVNLESWVRVHVANGTSV